MARPPLDPGEWGEISVQSTPNERFRARCRFRTPTGDLIQVEASGKSAAEAKRRLKKRIEKWLPEDSRRIAREVAKMWLANLLEHGEVRPQTVATYEATWQTALAPKLGSRLISNITPAMMEEVLDDVHINKPGLYGSSMTVCRGLFSFAARRGMVEHSPMTSVQRRKARPLKQVRALDLDELAGLRGMVREWQAGPRRSQPLLDVVDLSLSTGARIGELLALKWEDVDLDGRTLVLSTTQVWVRGKGVLDQGQTKESTVLRLPMTDFAATMLDARRADHPDAVYVFPSRAGGMISRANLDRAWRAARGETFEWVTWHTFRKSVATLAATATDSKTAARLLGHTSDKITRAHYIVADDVTAVPDLTAVLEALSGEKVPELSFDDGEE